MDKLDRLMHFYEIPYLVNKKLNKKEFLEAEKIFKCSCGEHINNSTADIFSSKDYVCKKCSAHLPQFTLRKYGLDDNRIYKNLKGRKWLDGSNKLPFWLVQTRTEEDIKII